MELRAVTFDAMGTLFVPREPVGTTYSRLAREFGVDLPEWRIEDAFQRVLARAPHREFPPGASRREAIAIEREWWRRVVRSTFKATDQTAGFSDPNAFFEAVFEYYAGAAGWALVAEAAAVLARLRSTGLRIGVVSNFDHRLPKVLEALGIVQFIDCIVLPIDCGVEKPDPRIFECVLERLGLPAGSVLHLGDDPTRDVEGASAAGLHALAISELGRLSELPERIARLATLPRDPRGGTAPPSPPNPEKGAPSR